MILKKPKLLSIIIPVFGQEKTIEKDLRRILAEMDLLKVPFEIIAVIDGDVDKSMINARKVRSKNLMVAGYKHNRGKGFAVRFGMAKAKGDIVGFVDSGQDLHINSLSMMLEHFFWYNADIIIGSKRHPVSKVEYPLYRKVMSRGYQILVWILFGLKVRDTQVGMKLYRRNVLDDVMPRLLVKQFAFDIEILAVAHHLGYDRIYESPVELNFKENVSSISTSNFWRIIFKTLWDTLAVFYRLWILKYYDDTNKRKWKYDPELDMKINVG